MTVYVFLPDQTTVTVTNATTSTDSSSWITIKGDKITCEKNSSWFSSNKSKFAFKSKLRVPSSWVMISD